MAHQFNFILLNKLLESKYNNEIIGKKYRKENKNISWIHFHVEYNILNLPYCYDDYWKRKIILMSLDINP